MSDLDAYLDEITGTWTDDDPVVLSWPSHEYHPVVADVDGTLRVLSSGLIYPRDVTRRDLEATIDDVGAPAVDRLSHHATRFDRQDFEEMT